jgi:nucleotide-binding universal stress UspA family protein
MPSGGVVATINGSHNDHQVLAVAAEEATRTRKDLTLLYVIVVGWDRGLDQSEAAALLRCDRIVESAEAYLKLACGRRSAESKVVQARSVGGGIVELARQIEADLVVIGTPHHLGDHGLELGPTATYVLKHAPCRVLASYDPLV